MIRKKILGGNFIINLIKTAQKLVFIKRNFKSRYHIRIITIFEDKKIIGGVIIQFSLIETLIVKNVKNMLNVFKSRFHNIKQE